MKLLSNLKFVFSLIGSAVFAPSYAAASDFGSNTLMNNYDMGLPRVGGSIPFSDPIRAPILSNFNTPTISHSDLWIEGLRIPTMRPNDQGQ